MSQSAENGKVKDRKKLDPLSPGDAALEPELLDDREPDSELPEDDSLPLVLAGGDSAESNSTELVKYDPLRLYLMEIAKFTPLSREEEHRLAVRYREEGDLEAARTLISANLKLVVRIAFLFTRFYQNVMDLVQEGNIGLMQAVQKFDPFRGVRLSTYATFWIRAYILKFLTDNWRLVRVGTTNVRRKLLHNLEKEKNRLRSMGIDFGPKLLAEKFGTTEEEIRQVEESIGASDLSLDQPLGVETDRTLVDVLAGDSEPLEDQLVNEDFRRVFRQKVEQLAETLSERERFILEHRLLAEDPVTLQEIGDRYGITREGSRMVEKKLLSRLKNHIRQQMGGAVVDNPPNDSRKGEHAGNSAGGRQHGEDSTGASGSGE